MTRIIAALLAAATIAGVAVPAAAQTKYYARERLSGMPKTSSEQQTTAPRTYTPVYSTTFGTCSGGTQSKPITGCTSDNSTVAVSNCSAFPQSTGAQSCTTPTACGTLKAQTWFNGGTQNNLGYVKGDLAAQEACNLFIAGTGKIGVCAWDNGNGSGSGPAYFFDGGTTRNPGTNFPRLYASACQ